jgi:sortase A
MQKPNRLHGRDRWSRFLFAVGSCCVLCAGTTFAFGELSTRASQREFVRQLNEAQTAGLPGFDSATGTGENAVEARGRAVFGEHRSRLRSAAREGDLVGLLAVPRLNLVVPVREGTSESTLLQGAGHVTGTARPGRAGNVALAAHRDMHFRPLREVRPGDEVRLTTLEGTRVYTVRGTAVVEPDDVSVLRATPEDRLTLITCYPFSYVGRAPRRFLVFADAVPAATERL